MRAKLLWYAFHPLGLLWLLTAVAIAGGLVELVFFDRSPWEGLGAAFTLAGLTKIVAHVKGIPAWPWDQPTDQPATDQPQAH